MPDLNRKWTIEEGWSPEYKWFLVDEGKIWYSFVTRAVVEEFQREHFMSDKLLVPEPRIPDVLMTQPDDYRAWRCKSPVTVRQIIAN